MIEFIFSRISFMRHINKKVSLFRLTVIFLFLLASTASFRCDKYKKEEPQVSVEKKEMKDAASTTSAPEPVTAQQVESNAEISSGKESMSEEADRIIDKIVKEGI